MILQLALIGLLSASFPRKLSISYLNDYCRKTNTPIDKMRLVADSQIAATVLLILGLLDLPYTSISSLYTTKVYTQLGAFVIALNAVGGGIIFMVKGVPTDEYFLPMQVIATAVCIHLMAA